MKNWALIYLGMAMQAFITAWFVLPIMKPANLVAQQATAGLILLIMAAGFGLMAKRLNRPRNPS